MPRTRIKICGVRDARTAAVAVESGADAIGLVFASASPRHVTAAQARAVVDELPPFVEPIGLFVDAPAEEILKTCAEVGLRTIQLHGKQTPQFAAALAPLRVIKAFAFQGPALIDELTPWSGPRNFAGILLDAPPEKGPPDSPGSTGSHRFLGSFNPPGGTGRSFDWDALLALRKSRSLPAWAPLIIAGGLTPENVTKAITLLTPYAVDVSSGVESVRGVKDPEKIAAFCEAVRQTDGKQRG